MGKGLPKKYAKMGFKKGWREYKKSKSKRGKARASPRKTRRKPYMARRRRRGYGKKYTRIGGIRTALLFNFIWGGFGQEVVEQFGSGGFNEAVSALKDRLILCATPGSYQFNAYTVPMAGSQVGGIIADKMDINPKFSFGKGRRRYIIKVL